MPALNHSTRHSVNFSADGLWRLAAWCAPASAVAAAVGMLFLVIFYIGVPAFGTLNDLAVIVQYALLLPIFFRIARMTWNVDQPKTIAVHVLGLLGILAVITLQTMLVFDILPFQRQILFVIPAFLVVMVWFVFTERIGSQDERLPKGKALAVLAGLVIGYPFWAFEFRKRQLSDPTLKSILVEGT